MWLLMIYYTLAPWSLGLGLEIKGAVDISAVTWILVALSMVNTLLWFSIQTMYLLYAKGKAERRQRFLINVHKDAINTLKPLVSILIPARNEEDVIQRTVQNCLKQTYDNIEVIVVCHNCSDKTFQAAQSTDPRVRVFEYKTKEAGKGLALNHAVEKSEGKYLLTLDSDGILATDFIETALPLFYEGFAALQGKILASNEEYNTTAKLVGLEGYLCSVPFMTVRTLLDQRTPLGGTGCMIDKATLIEVGGFRNALIDDFELSFRLYRHGYRIGFAPLSIIYNENPPAIKQIIRQRSRWIKGHFDLLKERVPEWRDPLGIIYWLTPVFMLSGLIAILLTTFGIVHYILLGYFPYKYSFTPINFWIGLMIAHYTLQSLVIIRDFGRKAGKILPYSAILLVFTHYWHVTLIKAWFVKSWATTKTTHGFTSPRDMEQLPVEQPLIAEQATSTVDDSRNPVAVNLGEVSQTN